MDNLYLYKKFIWKIYFEEILNLLEIFIKFLWFVYRRCDGCYIIE